MSTGIVLDPRYLEHETGLYHPERPARLAAITERLRQTELLSGLDVTAAVEAERGSLSAVHASAYVERIERAIEQGAQIIDSEDTYVSRASFSAALLACGGATLACDRVMQGAWRNGFVASRPPGHHAERAMAMGFCLFNNVAVAAEHLRSRHGLARIAIIDWDVHHGNGTQHLFERDPGVFYASLHQWPHYPGTGRADERGSGPGEGATLNCPMPSLSGDAEWLRAFEGQVLPALEDFSPEFVLVSAGFDAHARDPLSSTRLSEEGFRQMTAGALELAASHCQGRLVSLLEGGYDLQALALSVEAHLTELSRAGG